MISGLAVARAFGKDRLRERSGLIMMAPLLGQRRQVAPGEVSVDALVHAGKLLWTFQRQDPPPAFLRPVVIADLPPNDRLTKKQLGVVRVDRLAFRTSGDRLAGLAQLLVGSCDPAILFARDRVGRRRAGQAVAQTVERLPPVLALD
ncbi:MAG: hypothetical protein ACLQVF_41260, partial [Isosphaeraceae bacterium]